MSFFNPLDVVTGGAHALPGTGVSQAAINAGKVGAPAAVGQGSLNSMLPIPAGVESNHPPLNQPMGSLQSLGDGQLNQSGMVNLRGPDGTTKAVPQSDLAHWLSKGASVVSGVGNVVRGMF